MKRCVRKQDGQVTDWETFCSSDDVCDGGYFCGKTNRNPNFGVTNFDNVMYAFLNVFQIVTLEGWSDIMTMVWQTVGPAMVIYFTFVVFAGAFFLLNLTLAVINYYFTEAQQSMASEEKAKQEQ